MNKSLSSRALVNRTIAAGLTVAGLIAAMILCEFYNVHRQNRQMDVARNLAAQTSELRFIVIETILYNEPRPAIQWRSKMATMRALLRSQPFDDAADNQALERIRENYNILDVLYERLRHHNIPDSLPDEQSERRRQIMARTVSALLVATQEMGDKSFQLVSRSQTRATQAVERTQWSVGLGLGVLILLLLALRKVVDRRILVPIGEVQKGTEQLALGNLSFRFQPIGAGEIGMLASRFNEMSAELERSHNVLMQEIEERKTAQQKVHEVNQQLVKAVARADKASRAKSEFLANMSHEIRTPLNGILGMTQLTLRTPLSPVQQEYLTIVRDSGVSLLRVINDILDFSKMEAGKLDLITQDFDLRERITACLRGFGSMLANKNVELILRTAPDVPRMVCGDADRLMQVVTNLVSNAIKFTDNGEILLSAFVRESSADGMTLQIEVRDTGIGIDPAHQQRVFDMFAQADSSTTRQYGGTGLGLSICSQLVRMMNGQLWLESQAGAGSTFRFTVRLAHAASQLPDTLRQARPLAGISVMIVDDNATQRSVLEEQLHQIGVPAVCCAGGVAALHELGAAERGGKPVSIVLMDEAMPEMSGIETARRIADSFPGRQPRIVMLSSGGQQIEKDDMPSIVVDWLRKPIAEDELLSILKRLTEGCATPSPDRSVAPPVQAALLPASRPLKLLLAEDQPINRKLAVAVLSKRGHTVVPAENGLEAVALFGEEKFDVILMDIQMPEMDGYRAAAEIRALEARNGGSHVQIVAVTAHALAREHRRCMEAGMDSVLIKPYSPEQLIAAVEGSLEMALPDPVPPAQPAPERAGPAVPDVFDMSASLRRVLGKRKLLCQMATMFVSDAPAAVDRLREAVASGDAAKLMQEAHRIKGSAGIFGASMVIGHAQALESMGRDGLLDGAAERLTLFESEMARLSAALQEMVMQEAA